MKGQGIYSTEVENEDYVIICNLKWSAKNNSDEVKKIRACGLLKPLGKVFYARKHQISNLGFAHFLVYHLFAIVIFTQWTRLLIPRITVTDTWKKLPFICLLPVLKKIKYTNFCSSLWL